MKIKAIHVICDGERTVNPGEEADFDTKTAEKLIADGAAQAASEDAAQPVSGQKSRKSKAKADDDDLSAVVAE